MEVRATRLQRLQARRAAQAATWFVALFVVGGALWFSTAKQVTLVVDGRPLAIRTTSGSVRDLLVGQGLPLDQPSISVQPPPATTLADGMTVVVSPSPGADPFGAFAYGPSSDVGVWVMEGMSEWSFGKAANSFAEASVSAPSVGLSPVVSVRAVVSGKVHDVLTNAGTTGELLSAMGIKPDADDRVLPSPSTPLHAGGSVRFDRVRIVTRVVHVSVPFDVHTRFTSALAPGTVQVLRQGAPGERVEQLRLTLVNGRVVARQILQSWFTHRPIPEERLSGPAPADGGTLDGSGSTGHRQFGEATWYDPPWSGLTAAHPWLPFGTRVTVTDLETGRSVSVIINDRGPFAAGRIIDLSPEAFSRLQPLGRGVLDVRIAW